MLEDLIVNEIRIHEDVLQNFRMFSPESYGIPPALDIRLFQEKINDFSPLLEAQQIHRRQEELLRIHGMDIRAMEEERRRFFPFLQEHQRQTDWRQLVGLDPRTIKDVLRAHEEFARWEKLFVFEVLGKRGRIGWERLLSNEAVARLFWLIRNKGKRAADLFVCEEFRKRKCERLRSLVNDWWKVPYLNKRRRKSAVIAAIRDHRKGKYTLLIPPLFTWVDGLTHEIATTFPMKYGSATSIRNLAAIYMERGLPTCFVNFEEAVRYYFYENFAPSGTARPRHASNRHGVIHGRIVNYATEPNSLKVILLINVLVTIFAAERKATRRCVVS